MNFKNEILKIPKVDYHFNVNLEKYTTIRLSKNGSIAIVKELESLETLIKVLNQAKYEYHLIGWGANQIIHNTENVLFIKLDFIFDRNYLKVAREEYILPASVSLNILTSHASKFGLSGWEVFTGIPASLGGAIFMNAGTNLGEIGSIIKDVVVLRKSGNLDRVVIDQKSFSYRKNHFIEPGDIIIEATLIHNGIDGGIKEKIKSYLELRKNTQPLKTKNCGCVFENYDVEHRAGQFIDVLGFKGLGVNGLAVSHKHANFIENTKEANSEDFIQLSNLLKYELELFSGIEFELEAKVY